MGSSGVEQRSHADVEYYGVFPSILFMCHDYSPMHFVLSLENTPLESISQAVRILRHCGADVTMDINEVTGHSVIFTDHNNIVHLNIPAFKYTFIRRCLEELKLLDIAPFMRKNSKYMIEGDKIQLCMEVVYFKLKTWRDIVKKSQHLCEPSHSKDPSDKDKGDPTVGSHIKEFSSDEEFEAFVQSGSTTNNPENKVNSFDVDSQRFPFDEEFDTLSESRFSTSTQIDSDCIEAIEEYQNSVESITRAAKNKQNMIKKNLVEDKLESGSDLKMPTTEKKLNAATRKKWTFVDGLFSDDSDIETSSKPSSFSKEKMAIKRKRNVVDLQENKTLDTGRLLNNKKGHRERLPQGMNEVTSSSTSWLSKNKSASIGRLKCVELQENKPSSTCLEREIQTQPTSNFSNKHTRQPYNFDERVKILQYIVENNAYSNVKGAELWKVMERREVLPSRTWQSMKEHFIKKIVVDLEPYNFLKDSQKKKLADYGI